jgi:hypothetical protein
MTFSAGGGQASDLFDYYYDSFDIGLCMEIMLQYNLYVCISTHNTISGCNQAPAPSLKASLRTSLPHLKNPHLNE